MVPTRENVTKQLPDAKVEPASQGILHGCVAYWCEQLKAAEEARAPWKAVADQCQTFFAGTARTFWNETFLNKYIGVGIQAPKFQLWIAKAFEFVAVMGPSVFWKNPRVTVEPNELKIAVDPMEMVAAGIFDEETAQEIMAEEDRRAIAANAKRQMFEQILNYMPAELPGGGGGAHAELSTIEAMVKGRGMLVAKSYQIPGSDREMVGMVHRSVDHLLVDPDAEDPNLTDAAWIAIRYVTHYRELEKKFGHQKGELRHAASISSAEWNNSRDTILHPVSTDRNFKDMVIWWEVYSRRGIGLHSYDSPITDVMEEQIGDFAYLAIAPNVHYPLNAPPAKLVSMSDQQVADAFRWPTPLWRAGKFPVAMLDFYQVNRSTWPMPPLAMCLGELIALNVLVSSLVTRAHASAQEIIGVIKEAESEITSKLQSSQSPLVIELRHDLGNKIEDIISFIKRPDISQTVLEAIQMLMGLIDQRTGLVPHLYGQSPTQDRSALATQTKDERAGIRQDYMRRRTGDWLREANDILKCLAGWNLKGDDVAPILGMAGAVAWDTLVSNGDPDDYLLDLHCHVEVADMQRPDKAQKQTVLQVFTQNILPVLVQYAQMTGSYDQVNAYLDLFGEVNEMDMSGMMLSPPQPQEQQIPPEQQAMMEAEARKAEADAAKVEADAQRAAQQLEFDFEAAQTEQDKFDLEVAKTEQEMQIASETAAIDNLVKLTQAQTAVQTATANNRAKAIAARKPAPAKAAAGK